MQDIVRDESLTSFADLPPVSTIHILGTGPNGIPHYKRIPKNATVIGVNKAIMLHGAPPREQDHDITKRMKQVMGNNTNYHKGIPMWLWLCSDTGLPNEPWFLYHINLLIRCDFKLSDQKNPTVVLGTSPDEEKSLHKKYPGAAYKATYGHHLKKTPAFKLLWPGLRGGASVGAQAVQLAYFMGAREIVLCGIDMAGKKYFDQTENQCTPNMWRKDGTSRHLPLFNKMIESIHKETCAKVVSLSKTALEVEQV